MYGSRPTIMSVLAADAYIERRAPQAAPAPAPVPPVEPVAEVPAQAVAEHGRFRFFRRNRATVDA